MVLQSSSARRLITSAGTAVVLCLALATSEGSANAQTTANRSVARPSSVQTNSRDGQKYAWIPPGTFRMGCSEGDNGCFDEEKPTHIVTITRGFWLGQTEVTVAAYKRFAHATKRQMPPEPKFLDRPLNEGWLQESRPITNITWEEAMGYCEWAGGQLPTEAEWEYAARGGTCTAQYGLLDRIAWYGSNSGILPLDAEKIWQEDRNDYVRLLFANGNHPHDVAQKQANDFGLFDMLGNVWEWTRDWHEEGYYHHSPSQDPHGPASGQNHVIRGGSWSFSPSNLRVSARAKNRPESRADNRGFRCAQDDLTH